ncbi:MAG: branched-chain amino acid ABC transporter permease [Proteobacteria bacterium]|nr:MAG: branched-chain amino acid ABC transporter permease [Pseudomonadota bacterium]
MVRGRRAVLFRAIGDSLSLPAFILLTTMMGFGSLARVSGFAPEMATAATLLIWGLPGQLAMVDAASAGHGLFSAVMACSLANARFLPMVVSFLPTLGPGSARAGQLLGYAQLLSINSWAMCLKAFPGIHPAFRRFYYLAFALSILSAAIAGTLLGYHASGVMPDSMVLGFVFLSPLFFALVLSSVSGLPGRLSLVFGCVVMVFANATVPDFDLVVSGVVGGSLGFVVGRRVEAGRRVQ